MSERAVMRLGGKVGMMNGPTTSVGITLMKSILFSLAASQAAVSANVFDTKYICRKRIQNIWGRECSKHKNSGEINIVNQKLQGFQGIDKKLFPYKDVLQCIYVNPFGSWASPTIVVTTATQHQ